MSFLIQTNEITLLDHQIQTKHLDRFHPNLLKNYQLIIQQNHILLLLVELYQAIQHLDRTKANHTAILENTFKKKKVKKKVKNLDLEYLLVVESFLVDPSIVNLKPGKLE